MKDPHERRIRHNDSESFTHDVFLSHSSTDKEPLEDALFGENREISKIQKPHERGWLDRLTSIRKDRLDAQR
jgi:hypothetical protein